MALVAAVSWIPASKASDWDASVWGSSNRQVRKVRWGRSVAKEGEQVDGGPWPREWLVQERITEQSHKDVKIRKSGSKFVTPPHSRPHPAKPYMPNIHQAVCFHHDIGVVVPPRHLSLQPPHPMGNLYSARLSLLVDCFISQGRKDFWLLGGENCLCIWGVDRDIYITTSSSRDMEQGGGAKS